MGNRDNVELLLAKGADIHAKNSDGDTPLHHAALWGRNGVVELLITQGADIHAKNNEGKTPLDRVYCDTAELLRNAEHTE